jgi:hypothetical protein
MKNLITKVMFTILMASLILGCDFNDDATEPNSGLRSIDGTWELTNIKNDKVNHDYNSGDISWNIDSKSSTIIVENHSKDYDGLVSGKYTYSLYQQVISRYITINGLEVGLIKSNANRDVLIIDENKKRDEIQTDGYILTFRR